MKLENCYLFEGLSKHQRDQLILASSQKEIPLGQAIFCEGQYAGAVYVLKEGVVELFTFVDAEHTELPVSMLRSTGDCFGLGALVPPYRYTLSARCAEACQVIALKQQALGAVFSQDHELSQVIMTNMSRHLLETIVGMRKELKIHFKNLFHSARY